MKRIMVGELISIRLHKCIRQVGKGSGLNLDRVTGSEAVKRLLVREQTSISGMKINKESPNTYKILSRVSQLVVVAGTLH